MKAWEVKDLDSVEQSTTVVFAETRGKAKQLAMNTDTCEDAEFTRISCRRFPEADKLYRPGMKELDWYDPETRIFLVKHGWQCLDNDLEWCEKCAAKEWCGRWEDANE